MGRFVAAVLGASLVALITDTAQAQTSVLNPAEAPVTARDDAGTAAKCAVAFQLRNTGTTPLVLFAADMRTSAELTIPFTTIQGISPSQSKEFSGPDVDGARCEQVRLQVTSVTCMGRCDSVAWTQRGLGAFEDRP